jgi:hypothetical protein
MNTIELLLVMPAFFVFAFKKPTFDMKRLAVASLGAPPAVTSEICCGALSHAWRVTLFTTLMILLARHSMKWNSHLTMLDFLLSPSQHQALENSAQDQLSEMAAPRMQ